MVVQKSLSGSILQYEMDNIYDPLKQGGSPGGGRSSSKGSSGRMRKVR